MNARAFHIAAARKQREDAERGYPITDRTDASHGEFKMMLVRFGEADPDAYIRWGEDHDGGDAA